MFILAVCGEGSMVTFTVWSNAANAGNVVIYTDHGVRAIITFTVLGEGLML